MPITKTSGWGSGGWDGSQSSIGGVSAVNPQANGDYQQYQDAAFANAKQRLDPIMQQQRSAYDQQMVNMGIPIGGEAYNNAFQQLDQNQNDAWNNASFAAMQFGADMQNQDFNQDATRAGLANALLQSRWNTDLGYYNTDATKEIAANRLNFDYSSLSENARQFDGTLGFNYAGLGEDARQYDLGLGENQRQYDLGFGENQRQFDMDMLQDMYKFDTGMDWNYFNADRDDMRWLTELDNKSWNDQNNLYQWSDALGMKMVNPYDPSQLNPNTVRDNFYPQQSQYNTAANANQQWWQALQGIFQNWPTSDTGGG